jgi:hypothetical protein
MPSVADLGGAVHDDAVLVLEDHAAADLRREGQLDAVEVAHGREQRAPQHAERRPKELAPDAHAPHSETVHEQRLEAGACPVAVVRVQIFAHEPGEGRYLRSRQARPER